MHNNKEVAGPLCLTTITDFATNGRIEGKAVLTTFHSSKGRQFGVVIIPGLVEGIMPPLRWSPSRMKNSSRKSGAFFTSGSHARAIVFISSIQSVIGTTRDIRFPSELLALPRRSMQSLPKGKVREKKHSRYETMIVKGAPAAVRWFRKATVARNSAREEFYETYRSRKSPIFPANWKLRP